MTYFLLICFIVWRKLIEHTNTTIPANGSETLTLCSHIFEYKYSVLKGLAEGACLVGHFIASVWHVGQPQQMCGKGLLREYNLPSMM